MKIKCTCCGHEEETTLDFWVKIIGGVMPLGGFWAWTTYLLAGTGLALPLVVAIIAGGTATLIYKDEIAEKLSQIYECPDCGKKNWQGIKD
ncbi:hypothetical protein AB3A93_003825 [Vibrio parahaemolyticus]|uniref:hypothetical protein n=1 Tax=Vibrio parahaemolyticus TaxID=670 RepID=UPI00084B8EC9|nr:hypothetical protein [Vibrio parahaemolyticus]EGQ8035514.1 hypothetical protein [Vibrio parahaemolyticus]EHD2278807.1 hypothetical protein [Vibrio parahaemolyticus]EHH2494573.1 hypothetical protein [Vibrio parahaemolyticus]EHR0871778.1 hypothetical protein [Vibrio parahaemolyticus]EID4325767.1 hypothetical protein [Vibrio parahaemolyticus]